MMNCRGILQITCILWRSMTAAESLLMGLGVLLTTTLKTHCSNLCQPRRRVNRFQQAGIPWRDKVSKSKRLAYTTRSSCFTKPKSCLEALRSKKLKVRHPYMRENRCKALKYQYQQVYQRDCCDSFVPLSTFLHSIILALFVTDSSRNSQWHRQRVYQFCHFRLQSLQK